jgi:hypothetical protein
VNVLKKRAAIVEEAHDEEGGGGSGEDGRDPGQHLFLPSEEDEPKLGVETTRSVYRFRSDDGQTGERRDKPACCRGCKSPTGKEVANPS